jgi:hypothetical protein
VVDGAVLVLGDPDVGGAGYIMGQILGVNGRRNT